MPKRRVVITGIGIVSALGNDREQTWARLLNGESGAGPITTFNAEAWPTKIAHEVKNMRPFIDDLQQRCPFFPGFLGFLVHNIIGL